MDCSWVKTMAKRRPTQQPPFYENKKGTFDSEKICLGLGIDEIHYAKLLEYISHMIGPNSLKSRSLTRDIRRRLRKTLDPILHSLPPAWAAKCIDQLIVKAGSNSLAAKRQERGRVLEPRKELQQNLESRYSLRASSKIRVEPPHDVPTSIRQAPTHPGWPAAGYQTDPHGPRDPTQFPRRRLIQPAAFDTDLRRNSEGIAEEIIRPPSVTVKREFEPDDNIINRPTKGYIVTREPTEINRQNSRATMDRYIPEFEPERFIIRNSFPPDILRAPEDRGLEERARERRTLDERTREDRIREERIREERIREDRIRDERIRDERPLEERARERRALEERAIEERARDRRATEEWPRERRAPDLWTPERRAPDLWAPDRRAPERRAHDRWAPEVRASDRWAPEGRAPERRVPEVRAPERRALERWAPEKWAHEGKASDRRAPEMKVVEGKVLEVKNREGKAPEGKALEGKTSELKALEVKAPEVKVPEIKPLEIKAPEGITSEPKAPEENTIERRTPEKKIQLIRPPLVRATEPEKQAEKDQALGNQVAGEQAIEQQTPKDQTSAEQVLDGGTAEKSTQEKHTPEELFTEVQAPEKKGIEKAVLKESSSEKILPEDVDIKDRLMKAIMNDESLENSTSAENQDAKQECLEEGSSVDLSGNDKIFTDKLSNQSKILSEELLSQPKSSKGVPINEMAFLARRGSGDWVLLGTGNDLMGSSDAPDWDIFLSRLKVGLNFSLEADRLFCPWLSYTNGEELVGIFDAFGWRAGIRNMYRRGLSEFRFEVKKHVKPVVNQQQKHPLPQPQPHQQLLLQQSQQQLLLQQPQQQPLQELLQQPLQELLQQPRPLQQQHVKEEEEEQEQEQEGEIARSSSLSSLDSYNDQ